ncbi:TetR family transcriptional regulator [Streptomyces maremycinicus]|nr:TetR family transcriptional regulator [Streptomyces sp. B9173]
MASQEIRDTAIRLFTAQGYEQTTTDQIARETGVSQRTLFRYFGSKEDLVCGEQDQLGALLIKTVEEQPSEVSPWGALRAGFAEILTANHTLEQALTVATLIFDTPALRARYEQKRIRWQYDLMPVVRERLRVAGREGPLADHEGRTIIAVSFACSDVATGTWIASEGQDDLVTLYDQAFALVRSAPSLA